MPSPRRLRGHMLFASLLLTSPLLVNLAGCGLVSSDIAALSFNLPARQYVFDTHQWNLPPEKLPQLPCTTDADCCAAAALVGYQCGAAGAPQLTCQADVCGASMAVESPPQKIDLAAEVPELSSIKTQSIADIYISRIEYSVVSTLNTDLPPVELYLAPADATSVRDERARKFGTVPAIPANANETGQVALEPDAPALLSGYARNLGTPFVFLSATTVVVRGGDPLPDGTVDITVRGQLRAQLSVR